ncbi:MAG: DUF3572 domain-containing protein [Sphingomonadaceae bacterium]|nr:DUF3572 domain-containing protein [Sphingomonadaceae bacterium]MDW8414373.1 DUF3572 family protein [Thermaurantiacus sp.]
MLRALAVIVAEEHLRSRFLALTGYTPHDLVARAGRPDLRHAVADFLAGHEPDLRFVAARLGLEPRRLCAPC